jgi:hypothetical protein
MVVIALSNSSFAFSTFFIHLIISSGVRPVLPMGVAPEAIVENVFSSIGSNKLSFLESSYNSLFW